MNLKIDCLDVVAFRYTFDYSTSSFRFLNMRFKIFSYYMTSRYIDD